MEVDDWVPGPPPQVNDWVMGPPPPAQNAAVNDWVPGPPPSAPPKPQGPQIILPEQEVKPKPQPMMLNGPVLRRVPGTTSYRSGDVHLEVPGSKPTGETVSGQGIGSGQVSPEEMPTGQLIKHVAETPLIPSDTFSGQNSDTPLGYGMDAAQSAMNAGAGMTSPENLAIMAVTMGLGAVPGILAKLGSAGVSAYFATQAGKQALQQFPELAHHAQQGDWHAVAANAGAIAANVGMAVGAGTHALSTAHGIAAEDVAAQQPKAAPPTKVKSPSDATPNVATAYHATTPESPETVALQIQQLGSHGEPIAPDQRRVVMFPKGQGQPLDLPQGTAITHDAFGNTYLYRPDLIEPGQIHTAAKNNTLPELLGGPEGMGAPDKAALQGEPITVVGRAPDGTEAQSTATDQANLQQTVQATHMATPPGGSVSVEPPEGVIAERQGMPAPPAEPLSPEPQAGNPEPTKPPQGPVYMGSMFGALEPLWHESIAEAQALKAKMDAANAEIERAKATPAEKHFGQKVIEFFTGERDFWSARANQLVDQVRRTLLPDKIQREALSLMRDFKNRPGELQQFRDGTHPAITSPEAAAAMLKLQPAIDLAMNPTPEMLQADRAITTLAAAELSEGQKYGFLDSSLTPEEYVRHLLNPKGEGTIPSAFSGLGRAMGGKIGRRLESASKRTYPTLLHAVAEGLVPKTLDALDAMTINSDKFATVRATHMLIRQLKDLGVGKFGSKRTAPEDWVKLAPHVDEFTSQFTYPHPGTGEPVVGETSLYVPKYISDALRPITDPDYTNRILGFAKWRGFGAYTKAIQLGMSLFHATTENYMAMANMGPIGWAKALGADRFSPQFQSEERDAILHGMTTTVQGHTYEAYKGLTPGSIPTYGDIWKTLPGLKQMDTLAKGVTDFTFNNMQRKFKVMNYALEKAKWMADHPRATPGELNDALHSISKEINAIYGGLHWENMGVNKTSTEVARAIMLAPDWTFSNFANVKYATERGTPAGKMARMFWIRSAVGGIMGTQMLSLALSRHFSKHPTEVFMGTDADGKEIYQNVFFKGAPGDLVNLINNVNNYGVATGFTKSAMGKLNPMLRTLVQLKENKNYLGQTIVPPGSGPLKGTAIGAANLLKGLAPIPLSVTNFWDMARGPGSDSVTLPEFATTALAGTPPRHTYPQSAISPAEKIIIDYKRSQAGPGNPATPHSQASARIFLMAKTGDIAKARDLGRAAVAQGTMSMRDVNQAIVRARSVPLVGDLKNLPGPDALNVTMQVYEAATPEERKKIEPLIRHKLSLAITKPYEWNDATRASAMKYFRMKPLTPNKSAPGELQ